MLEYLIRRTDDEWFSFPFDQYPVILCPARTPSKRIDGWGSNRIEVEGEEISFSDEDPGFQVVFETGTLPEERADQIVSEICENIEARTGQKARIVKL
ncbi:MAG TPA: hypothetical protein VN688_17955 [Gemmataceae bacterium]|nr:hypothetical protein [Gemmataceae bacterium]